MRRRIRIGRIGDALITCASAFAAVGLSQTPIRKLYLLRAARSKLGRLGEREYERTLSRLRRIGVFSKRDATSLILTEKGQKILGIRGLLAEKPTVPKRREWDGKWRVVVFDVRARKKRDLLRAGLKSMGFSRVQQSVWAHPGECRAAVARLAGALGAEADVRLAVAERLDDDHDLRRVFRLDR